MADVSIQVLKAAKAIVSGFINGDNLILQTVDGTQINAGNVRGPAGTTNPTGNAGGSLSGTYPNPTIAASVITDANVAAANKDGVAAKASMRTLGTGAQQAMAGNDSRLADSGWSTLAFTGNATGGSISIRNIGSQVFVQAVGVTFTSTSAGTGVSIVAAGGIPAALRPAQSVYVALVAANLVGRMVIGSDGSVTFVPMTGTMNSGSASAAYVAG